MGMSVVQCLNRDWSISPACEIYSGKREPDELSCHMNRAVLDITGMMQVPWAFAPLCNGARCEDRKVGRKVFS